jgi:hypothetical protein
MSLMRTAGFTVKYLKCEVEMPQTTDFIQQLASTAFRLLHTDFLARLII